MSTIYFHVNRTSCKCDCDNISKAQYRLLEKKCKKIHTDDTKKANDAVLNIMFPYTNDINDDGSVRMFSQGNIHMIACGQIYNKLSLIEEFHPYLETKSSCEIILWLYKKFGIETAVKLVDGQFIFVILDLDNKHIIFSRDFIGQIPFYYNVCTQNRCLKIATDRYTAEFATTIYSSDEKNAVALCRSSHVEPGHIYVYDLGIVDKPTDILTKILYWTPIYCPYNGVTHQTLNHHEGLLQILCESLESRLTKLKGKSQEIGFIFPGDIGSAIVLALSVQLLDTKIPIRVFTFSYSNTSPNVVFAARTIEFLKHIYAIQIDWHLIVYGANEISEAMHVNYVDHIVSIVETSDPDVIHESLANYIMAKHISEKTNVRTVLSGMGANELFGLTQQSTNLSPYAFRAEIMSQLKKLHRNSCLGASACFNNFDIEIRYPYLDECFVSAILTSRYLTNSGRECKFLLDIIQNAGAAEQPLVPFTELKSFAPVTTPGEIIKNFNDAIPSSVKELITHTTHDIHTTNDTLDTSNMSIKDTIIHTRFIRAYYEYLFNKRFSSATI